MSKRDDLQRFYMIVQEEKELVELVLDKMREQGLLISESSEGFQSYTVGNIGSVGEFLCLPAGKYPGDMSSAAAYVIYWKITDPKSERTTTVRLGIKSGSFWKSEKFYRHGPSITVKEVEDGINLWLKQSLI